MIPFTDKPSGAGAFAPALTYQARVLNDSGIIADSSRAIEVYLSVVPTPSLLCACDAYKATVLYNVIPE